MTFAIVVGHIFAGNSDEQLGKPSKLQL